MTHVYVWGSAVVDFIQIILVDSFYQDNYFALAQCKAIKMQITNSNPVCLHGMEEGSHLYVIS